MTHIDITDSLGNKVHGVASIPDKASSVVVRYDYYGHGPAYGYWHGYGASSDVTLTKAVGSLDAVLKYLRELGDFRIGLVGSSFGGLLSLIAASRDSSIKVLALKSPVAEPISFWRRRVEEVGPGAFADWERNGVIHYRKGLEDFDLTWGFWQDLQGYDTLADARQISCPVLIVHGDNDSYVPIEQSHELARTLGTEVNVVQGADHGYEKPEQYEEAKRLLRDFMLSNLR